MCLALNEWMSDKWPVFAQTLYFIGVESQRPTEISGGGQQLNKEKCPGLGF